MQIRHVADIPVEERQTNARGGKFVFQRILEGPSGSPDNFYWQIARTFRDFDSPRHRHNFDQIRLQLEGCVDFSKDGKMTPGTIGYFPEGTRYGPQSSTDDALVAVLQFGGASGDGYMSEDQFQYGVNQLKLQGEFRNGAYFRTRPDGKLETKDGYQAVWEFVKGRALEYSEERYHTPIMIYPEHFRWVAMPKQAGVTAKKLGVFTEVETRLELFRIEPGAALRADENSIYFVLSGHGKIGESRWLPRTTIYLQRGESAQLSAETVSEVFHIGLPNAAARNQISDPIAAAAG